MNDQIEALEKEISKLKEALSAARRKAAPQPVRDYELKTPAGAPIRLSALFGGKPDLLVVHNMGKSCAYCTLWADGFQSLQQHLLDRAAFVLTSPDEPAVLREFAGSRGWTYPLASHAGTSFAKNLGFSPEPGKFWPGVSALRKRADGAIERTGRAIFGPGDDFCSVWHFFDLLDGGAKEWAPKYVYREAAGAASCCH